MIEDDELLAPYDLSAWEVPPPAAGLADAVVARARERGGATAVEAVAPASTRRWWFVGAGAAAVAAIAVIVIAIGGVRRAPRDGHGDVVATAARVLSIGPTSASIDAGTELRWKREGHTIEVAQARGAASWRVASDDTLRIDAGAMGASVEATGASLRVEVGMNRSDMRVVGVSAATAVVIAALTVVVYEGHVRVHHDGQTVNVVPGTTYAVPDPSSPDPRNVGVAPVDPRIRALEAENAELREKLEALEDQDDGEQDDGQDDRKDDRKDDQTVCDSQAFNDRGEAHLQTGMDAAALASFERALACAPSGDELRKIVVRAYMAACRSRNAGKAKLYFRKLPAIQQSQLAQMCVRVGIAVP